MNPTVAGALAGAARRLAEAGIASARLDARLLLEAATGLSPERRILEAGRMLAPAERAGFERLLLRRLAREPVAHILGKREFWSLPFAVSRATLIPRPDSEAVVAGALACVAERRARLEVLDLGTGTGCLLLALLMELPQAEGIGVDIVPEAAALARDNARALGLAHRARFVAGDWAGALAGRFDLIVANPPYIATAALTGLEPEVREHEPQSALDGGQDGFGCYVRLLPEAASRLAPRGRLVVEIGAGQEDRVAALAAREGLDTCAVHEDLCGRARALVFGLEAPGGATKGATKKGVGNLETTG